MNVVLYYILNYSYILHIELQTEQEQHKQNGTTRTTNTQKAKQKAIKLWTENENAYENKKIKKKTHT